MKKKVKINPAEVIPSMNISAIKAAIKYGSSEMFGSDVRV